MSFHRSPLLLGLLFFLGLGGVGPCVVNLPILTTPAHGAFVSGSTVLVEGSVTNANLQPVGVEVTVNGSVVPHQPDGTFSATVPLDPAEVFQPIVAEIRHVASDIRVRQRVVVIRGSSIPEGSFALDSLAMRINDPGFMQIEPAIQQIVSGDLDIEGLIIAQNPVLSQFVCIIPNPFGGCLSGITVEADVTSVQNGPVSVAVDSFPGMVAGDIGIQNMDIDFSTNLLGCDGDITTTLASLLGDFDLAPDAATPTQLDVNQQGGINVTFDSFVWDLDGLCELLEPLVGLLIGNVEDLVESGFEQNLNDPDGSGPQDAPMAQAIEDALANIDLAGPIGQGLGVTLDAPFSSVDEDVEGVSFAVDASITGPPPVAGAPDLGATLAVSEPFPDFALCNGGSNDGLPCVDDPDCPGGLCASATPGSGSPYGLGLCISTSAFNQLLKTEVEGGLLLNALTEIDVGTGPLPITAALLAGFIPEFATLDPATALEIRTRPTLGPVVTGNPGPAGELAELRIADLVVDIVQPDFSFPNFSWLRMHLDVRLGLDLAFTSGALSFQLATPATEDIDAEILGNAILADEALVQALLPNVVALLLPALTGSLDTFPLPDFLGLSLQPVEISRQGEFMSLFVDLAP